ncbi:calcium-binding protein [Caenimonas aquaedulcis]|uniref:RTX toxin n=1 Tax=Caenimonas aquaedulcis TaxID=2793270 RepID=A0A931H4N5_9BURK|nr:calcium-binding protein [Caenimonas aquaedulcis]MBG9388551.1 RTX toxin [Caenimonas aquaedulcis]
MDWVRPKDPLTLDLDNDGIEATAISPTHPVLFDHNADGVKTATGWISADDGLVVVDLNGNGLIDSGRELFGDNTLLPNGHAASNGFQAIAQYDANADGKIDAADAAFTQLRIWQDANQDGVSQAAELKSLAQLGIASINVAGVASTIQLGNGNSQPWSGSFTRINGSTGASGTPKLSGSLLLASNNFYREFTDDPVPTGAAMAVPQMGGSGWVRDLREAMSLGTDKAQALQDITSRFATATTRAAQMALVDDLISAWGDSTGKMVHSVGTYSVSEQDGMWVTRDFDNSPENAFGSIVDIDLPGMRETVFDPIGGAMVTRFTAEGVAFLHKLNALEAFNGDKFIRIPIPTGDGSGGQSTGGSGGGSGTAGPPTYLVTISPAQVNLLNESYDALRESVYASLALQTRLTPYLDSVGLVIDEQGLSFDTTTMVALLDTAHTANARDALFDLADLNKYAQPTLLAVDFDGMGTMRSWTDALPVDSSIRSELAAAHVLLGANTATSPANDAWLGDAANNAIAGGAGDDVLDGGAGNDSIQGGTGDDVLAGGTGNDILSGEYTNVFNGWFGGAGNDSYVFGRGDGQDTVYDFDTTPDAVDRIVFKPGIAPADVLATRVGDSLHLQVTGTADSIDVKNFFAGDGAAGWAIEQVQFADGTTWSVADVRTLVLTGGDAADTLIGFGTDDILTGNAGNDSLYGLGGNDTLLGGNGADVIEGDTLWVGGGNDLLVGGNGADTLFGAAGDDTLDGAPGNDLLAGELVNTVNGWYRGAGNDTYLFGRGDGQDTVYDFDTTAGVTDAIVFKAGVLPADVQVLRTGDSLLLKINGTSDQVQVMSFFAGDAAAGWAVEQVRFTDAPATVWSIADIKSKSMSGTAGNDNLQGTAGADEMWGESGNDLIGGSAGNDTLHGGDGSDNLDGSLNDDLLFGDAGNDTLQGGPGNDTMDGGAGNDVLAGASANTFQGWFDGAGNDTYRLGRGSGQDIVYDVDSTAGNLDTIVLAGGVLPADVRFTRSSNDLFVSIAGTPDRMQVVNHFAAGWSVEQIRFTDAPSVVLSQADVLDAAANGGKIVTNHAPTAVGTLAGWQAVANVAASYTVPAGAFNDVDAGDTRSYSASLSSGAALPTWLKFDTVTHAFSGTPTLNDGGDLLLTVKLTDSGGLTASQTLALHLNADLTLTGTSAADTLVGGPGNDTLNGLAGGDTMRGAAGDDTYYVDHAKDVVTELAGQGMDTVITALGYTLPANVERLVLMGTSAVNGVGNALDNSLTGNSAANSLQGGLGSDTYWVSRGSASDTIVENDATAGNKDVARFGSNIAYDQLWFQQSRKDLIVSIIGTNDKLTVPNWFAGTAYHVEQFVAGDGKVLLDGQVQHLVQAMAAYSPPPLGQLTLSPSVELALVPAFNADWH